MTRTEAKAFHNELSKTLEGLFEKYHLRKERSNISYGDASVRICITCEQLEADGAHKTDPLTESLIRSTLERFGVKNLPETLVGSKIKTNGQIFTITGFNARAPKYPLEIEGADGRRYKHTGRGVRFVC